MSAANRRSRYVSLAAEMKAEYALADEIYGLGGAPDPTARHDAWDVHYGRGLDQDPTTTVLDSDREIRARCERCGFVSPPANPYDLSGDGWCIAQYSASAFPESTYCDDCASYLGAFS